MPFPIFRRDGHPLILRAQRLRSELAWDYFSHAWALVTVVDPEERPKPSPGLLRDIFGLTPAEAKFAVEMLATDGDTSLVGERLGLTRETVRWYLKSVMAKTATRRQAEFVSLLLRLLR